MKKGLFGRRPVFIITGLKVARGFRSRSMTSATNQAQAGSGIPIADQLSVGAALTASHVVSREVLATSSSDIVFAYQLHSVTRKGWFGHTTSADLYGPKAALLGEEQHGTSQEEFEAYLAPLDMLLETLRDNEDTPVVAKVLEREGECNCLFLAEDSSY